VTGREGDEGENRRRKRRPVTDDEGGGGGSGDIIVALSSSCNVRCNVRALHLSLSLGSPIARSLPESRQDADIATRLALMTVIEWPR